ncbi:hypothetical protein ACFWBI_07795 [Streptomyces sp. NPDC059982]|uniref:hypothetical protein n=1 Tax=unclassified Streptomyces TaxID=2593676 RepID=UPI0036C2D704
MATDPVRVLHAYLSTIPESAGLFLSASHIGRKTGEPALIVDGTGGHRVIRHRADRADITIHSYHHSLKAAADLAYSVRERLLEELPGQVAGGGQVLDIAEVHSPFYLADEDTAEFRYVMAIAMYFTESHT